MTKPVSSSVLESIVSVPATSASCSSVLVRYVQPPTVVVLFVVVVTTGLVGESLADTETVLDGEHERLPQVKSPTSVEASVTDRSVPTVNVPARLQPLSSEITRERPVLEIAYVKMSTQADSVPSPFGKTLRFVSVQTWPLPEAEQIDESLKRVVPGPPPPVAAPAGAAPINKTTDTTRNKDPNLRTGHPPLGITGSVSPVALRDFVGVEAAGIASRASSPPVRKTVPLRAG